MVSVACREPGVASSWQGQLQSQSLQHGFSPLQQVPTPVQRPEHVLQHCSPVALHRTNGDPGSLTVNPRLVAERPTYMLGSAELKNLATFPTHCRPTSVPSDRCVRPCASRNPAFRLAPMESPPNRREKFTIPKPPSFLIGLEAGVHTGPVEGEKSNPDSGKNIRIDAPYPQLPRWPT